MLHVGTDPVPLAPFPFRIDAATEFVDWRFGSYLPFDQHIFLAPNAGCLAVIPSNGDRLEIYRVSMDQLTKKASGDFVYVTSKPPTTAKRGVEMRYAITAKSKGGDLTYRLVSGPPGAKLSTGGVVTWTPPDGTDEEIVAFSIAVRDGKGKELTHSFQVRVAKK
jgi:hypothetical protein